MFGIIKQKHFLSLYSIVNVPDQAKCVLLCNKKCKTQPALINSHSNKYSQKCHFYPFAIKLDRCVESCNTLNDLSNKVCVPNKTEDLNLSVFNMITRKNKSKTSTKRISCQGKCKFDKTKYNSNHWWNSDKYQCVCVRNIIYVKNIMFRILLHVIVKMENI